MDKFPILTAQCGTNADLLPDSNALRTLSNAVHYVGRHYGGTEAHGLLSRKLVEVSREFAPKPSQSSLLEEARRKLEELRDEEWMDAPDRAWIEDFLERTK